MFYAPSVVCYFGEMENEVLSDFIHALTIEFRVTALQLLRPDVSWSILDGHSLALYRPYVPVGNC